MIRTTIVSTSHRLTLSLILFLILPFISNAQNVTLNMENKPMSEVLTEITSSTGYRFVYSDAMHQLLTTKVTIKCDDTDLKEVLNRIFERKGISYKIEGKNIALAVLSDTSKQQQKKKEISGMITDDEGEKLVGVTVLNRNNGKFAISDERGSYVIEAGKGDILEYSFLGMVTNEATVGINNVINVSLKNDVITLSDIVVTGYQSISRERSTGAFTKLTTTDFDDKRKNSIDNLLEGKVAGYSNGLIRGVTSMNGMASPLYVIDGFPVENTKYNENRDLKESKPDINVDDIESITMLKDAAATSIYGARAANGVIVITTKQAKKGSTQINFSTSLTYTPYKYYTGNILGSSDMIDVEREWAQRNPYLQGEDVHTYAQNCLDLVMYQNQGMKSILNYYAGNISESQMNSTLDNLAGKGYNYYDQMSKYGKRDSFEQQYNINVGNRTDVNSFYASLTYTNNRFSDKYSSDQAIGLNITNSTNLTKWLQLDFGTYFKYGKGTTQTFDLRSPGYTYAIYDDLMNADGTHYTKPMSEQYGIYDMATAEEYGLYNEDITPLDEMGKNLKKSKDISLRTYARATIKFTDWLKYSAAFQYEYGRYDDSAIKDKESYAVRSLINSTMTFDNEFMLPYGDIRSTASNQNSAYNFRQQLDFSKQLGKDDKHDITALAGFEVKENKLTYETQGLYGYDDELLTYSQVDAARLANEYFVWGYYNFYASDFYSISNLVNRYVSLYANAAYTYDTRYAVTGSIRWDRSNLWGTSSKYQNRPTWSAGVSWNISNEHFFNASWVDMLKLRASYGIGGNIAKDSAPYMTVQYSPDYFIGGMQGMITRRPNSSLRWEQTATTNIGVDFAFFKNRLSGTVEVYDKRGKDLLTKSMGVPTEGFGFFEASQNNGQMTNRGFEVSLYGNVYENGNFGIDLSALFGYNKNKVTSVEMSVPYNSALLNYPESYPIVGNPFYSIYAYEWAGLSNTGLPQVYDSEGNKVTYEPYDVDALVYQGTTVPVYNGSFGLNLHYKGWSLSALALYEGGHKGRNYNLPMLRGKYSYATGSYVTTLSDLNTSFADRWRNPGDEATTNVPRLIFAEDPDYSSETYWAYYYASINVLDLSNFRLSNVSLSYSPSKRFCSKLHINGLRIALNVENVCTIAKSRDAKVLLNGYIKPSYVLGIDINF